MKEMQLVAELHSAARVEESSMKTLKVKINTLSSHRSSRPSSASG